MTERSQAYWAGGRSFDMRHVPGPALPHRRRRARPAPGGLGQAVRRPAAGRRAHRRAARPGRARLRVRLHDPRAGAARARPRRGPGPGWSPPASTTPCGSTAVPARAFDDWLLYAAGSGRGGGRPRSRHRPLLHPRPPSPGHRRPGRNDPHQLIPAGPAGCGIGRTSHAPIAFCLSRHLRPRPPAAGRASGRCSSSPPRPCSTPTASTRRPRSSTSRSRPSAPTVPPCARRTATSGPTASCSGAPTRSPRCWSRT